LCFRGAAVAHSSMLLLVLRGAKIGIDKIMVMMVERAYGRARRQQSLGNNLLERAEGVPVGNSPSATISWSVPRACP
jgi:hypothetical protein